MRFDLLAWLREAWERFCAALLRGSFRRSKRRRDGSFKGLRVYNGPKGTDYKVKTLKGNEVRVWKGDKGETWCHGFTLGGSSGYSVYSGPDVEKVLKDANYASSAVDASLKPGDIVTFSGYQHSVKVKSVTLTADGKLDWDKTQVETKNGQEPL